MNKPPKKREQDGNNMTDSETIKALECCKNKRCVNCPYDDVADKFAECSAKLVNDALDLINRQKAEIDEFNNSPILTKLCLMWKAEAIKEFAEKLKDRVSCIPQHHFTLAEVQYYIDNLAKEMTEETST